MSSGSVSKEYILISPSLLMLVQRKVPLTSGDTGQDGVWVWRLSMRGDTWGPFNHTGNLSREIEIIRRNKIEMLEIENTVTELCVSKRAHQETWRSWGKNLNLKIGPEKYINWDAKRKKSEKKWTEHPKAVWQRKSVRNGKEKEGKMYFPYCPLFYWITDCWKR